MNSTIMYETGEPPSRGVGTLSEVIRRNFPESMGDDVERMDMK
jgi:hypothetical protein